MRFLPILIFLIPVILLIAYFGIASSMMIFSIFLAPILILLAVCSIAINTEIPNKNNLWLFYGAIVGLLAAAFAIIVPFCHLMGYISLLAALLLWLIELPIYLFLLSLPANYYRHLKDQQRHK